MSKIVFGGSSGIGKRIIEKLRIDSTVVNIDLKENGSKRLIELIGDLRDDNFVKEVISKISSETNIESIVWSIRYRNKNKGGRVAMIKECMELEIYSFIKIIDGLEKELIRDGTSIVIISSIASELISSQEMSYNIVKAAQEAMARKFGVIYGEKSDVRFNCICPGIVGMEERIQNDETKTEVVLKLQRCSVPREKIVSAEEIAELVSFLTKKESSSINGARIVCDGGESIMDQYYVAARMQELL